MSNQLSIATLVCVFIFLGCSRDDNQTSIEQVSKTYELQSIQWKLNENKEPEIIEKKLPEFYFKNETDTIMLVIIEPLSGMSATSKFDFDSIPQDFQYTKVQVSIPKESSLSENYSYLSGGVTAALQEEESNFPFSTTITTTTTLHPQTELISNEIVYLKRNHADFLATFRDINSDEILRLEGSWTGIFLHGSDGDSVVNSIE